MVSRNRPAYIGRFILSFILATIVLLLVFLISNYIIYYAYLRTASQTNIIENQIKELTEFSAIANCENPLLFESSRRLDDASLKLDFLEEEFGKNDPRVLEQKKLYTELELKHFEIIKKINSECNNSFIRIMFFYSNKDALEDRSKDMGYVLSRFKAYAPEKIMIYSFDYNLDSYVIKNLKEKYLIEDIPIIIINERDILKVRDINDLDKYLEEL